MKIIKQKIEKQSQQLQARWTVTLDALNSTDEAYDKLIEKELAKTLQEEIDWEVMIDIMTEIGWTKIEMKWPHQMSARDAHEVKEWCRANLKGNYQGRQRIWLFEKEKDASMFALRWS